MATNELGDLLERVYALADDPAPDWTGALDALARHSGGAHGGIFGIRGGAVLSHEMSGVDPGDIRSAVEEHGASNPWGARLYADLGRVRRDHEVEPPGFDAHPIVRDHFDRMDMRRYMRVIVGHDGDRMTFLGVFRPRRAGPFDEGEVARFGQLARHALRAHALRGFLARVAALGASLEAGLAASLRATVLLDGQGRALLLNPAAEALVRRGVLVHRGGCLSVGDPAAAGRFAAALISACSRGAGASGDGAVVVLTSLDRGAPTGVGRHAAHVLVLPSSHPFRSVAPRAAACVQLVRLDGDWGGAHAVDPAVLRAAFGLTPREARLAAFVGAGGSIEEAGAAFGVSRNTVRAQLRAVFDKTGARRQPELVRLVQGLASLKG